MKENINAGEMIETIGMLQIIPNGPLNGLS